jgi:hypothetical protein
MKLTKPCLCHYFSPLKLTLLGLAIIDSHPDDIGVWTIELLDFFFKCGMLLFINPLDCIRYMFSGRGGCTWINLHRHLRGCLETPFLVFFRVFVYEGDGYALIRRQSTPEAQVNSLLCRSRSARPVMLPICVALRGC